MQKTNGKTIASRKPDELAPRERVLRTASDLFYKHGVHSVGVDRIIEESGVAKMTFYRHFPSKGQLVAEYLAQKESGWRQLINHFTGDKSKSPFERLLSIFDGLELAIRTPGFCGCPFIKALAEFGPERNEPAVQACIATHFQDMENVLLPLLKQVRPKDAKKLLHPLMSLITGTVVIAQATKQTNVARKNKSFARSILVQSG